MSQEKLAEEIDMGITSLSIIETGKGFITASNLEKIAEVLGVEASKLFKTTEAIDEEIMYKNILRRIEKYKNDKDKLILLDTFVNALDTWNFFCVCYNWTRRLNKLIVEQLNKRNMAR